jgi:hypothetical protein
MPEDPWFGPQHLPEEGEDVFVAWIDLMGIADSMSRSYQSAATNVGKLYVSVVEQENIDDVSVYPMVDGLYLLCEREDEIKNILSDIFFKFAKITNYRNNNPDDDYGPWLGFLIRGGVAQGTVYHGSDVDQDEDTSLANVLWLNNVPFGRPIANAHTVERGKSPYSITLHESATDSSENWRWYDDVDGDVKDDIVEYLESHFNWAMENIDSILYEESNIHHHATQAEEYFELGEDYFDL